MSSKSIAVIAVAGAGLALLFAAAAGAATNLAQKPGPGGCVTQNGIAGECADGSGLVGPSALAISPDAENVYAADQAWGGVATLSRNAGDGSLAPLPGPTGCLSTVDVDCSHPRLMEGARDLVISPDGKNVYVAAPGSNAVAVLSRDQGDGHLTQPSGTGGCVSGSGASGCGEGRAVDEPTTLVVSPDGKEVYVGSEGLNGGIAIFQRDQETGDLSQEPGGAGCVNESGTAGCTDGLAEMGGLETLSISPDGRTLYAMSPARDAVTLYSRDPETGALTPLPAPAGCLVNSPADGCSVVIGLGEPRGLAFSSVGEESAYLASERRDAILVFDRNPATGALTQKPGTAGCVSNTGRSDPMQAGTEGACVNGVAMDAINSIAVLPDGSALYATTRESDGVVVFGRAADGTIAQRPGTDGCITETGFEVVDLPWTEGTCQDGRGLLAADEIVASADGAHIYTSARYGGIDAFDVVAPPGPEQRPTAGTAAGPTISQACKEARARAAKIADRLKALAKENKRKARKATFVTSEAARDKLNEAADRGRRQAKSIRLSLRQANLTVRQLCL